MGSFSAVRELRQRPEAHRRVGGFRHRAKRRSRTLYKAEVNGEGTSRRFVVTNLPGHPRELYPVYYDRGTVETFIKQLKNALKADRLSCHSFVADAFRLQIYALAYDQTRAFKGCGQARPWRTPLQRPSGRAF